jgi:hypothetical protein
MFHLDQLERLEPVVIEKALEDRHRFDKIYKVIEKYINDNKLIIGGTVSIKKVTNTPKDQFDYNYVLYSENPLGDGFNISNACADLCEATLMRTEIYGKEFCIRVQDRPLVTLTYIGKHMRDIIRPLNIEGLLYVPPDFHLLQIYRNLYIPQSWEDPLKDESKLYKWLKVEYDKNRKKFVGAAEDGGDFRKIKVELKKQMLKYLSERKDIILTGACAYNIMVEAELGDSNIEILGTESIASEMVDWIKSKVNLVVNMKKSDVMLISDFRLNRTTIFISADKVPILYVYNSLEYDVVPYNMSSHTSYSGQIGNPFVIMRYILIDIWIIKVIRAHGGIDEEFAKRKILDSYERLFNIRDRVKIDKDHVQLKADDNLWAIFQSAEDARYIGQYLSDITARKAIIKSQDFIPDYLPIKYKHEKGQYQTLIKKESRKGGEESDLEFLKTIYDDVEGKTLDPIYNYNDLRTFSCNENYNVLKLGCHNGQRKLLLTEIEFLSKSPKLVIYAGSAPNEHMPILLDMFPEHKFLLIDPNYHTFDHDYKYVYINPSVIGDKTIAGIKKDLSNDGRRRRNAIRLTKAKFIDGSEHDVTQLVDNVEIEVNPNLIEIIQNNKDRVYIIQDYMTPKLIEKITKSLKKAGNPKIGFISDIRTNLFASGPLDIDCLWNDGLQFVAVKSMRPTVSMLKFHPPLRYSDDNSVTEFVEGKISSDIVKDDLKMFLKNYKLDLISNYNDGKHMYFANTAIYLQAWAPKTSTEARLIIAEGDIDKPLVNYDYNEWWDKFRYLKYLRGYAYFSHYAYFKEDKWDGCFDCMLETIILADYLMKSNSIKLDTSSIMKWLLKSTNSELVIKLREMIDKSLLYPIDRKGIHGHIKGPPDDLHFYEFQQKFNIVNEINSKLERKKAYAYKDKKLFPINGYKLSLMHGYVEKSDDLSKLASNINKSTFE